MEIIRRIVFICTGNICRSPMALGFARREANDRRISVELSSAGTSALDGSAASRNAVDACAERDIDISEHRASQFDPSGDDHETLYVCMTPQHIHWLRRIGGIPAERLVLLGSGIPDPYGGDLNLYRRTREIIEMEVRDLFDSIAPQLRVKMAATESQRNNTGAASADTELLPVVTDMQESDLDDVAELETRCFRDPWSRDALAESLADPCAKMMVALYGGTVCGYVCLMLTDEIGYIPRVCVRPAFRRRGVATALLDTAETAARVFGCTSITLEVRESNAAAIALYESLGYYPLGRRQGFYTDPIEAALVMTRQVESWEDEE